MKNYQRNINALKKITAQYNPENDTPEIPVTYADIALLIVLNDVIETIEELIKRVETLETSARINHTDTDY